MTDQWATDDDRNVQHVYPLNDMREHSMSIHCWCDPDMEEVGVNGLVITHNSLDGREAFEQGRRKPS